MARETQLKPWSVTTSKVVHSTQWLSVIADTCHSDNKTLTYTYVKRVDEGPLIIPVTDEGKFWMVRQYRHPVKKILWQFPVEGKLHNESWEAAAARGLSEELQLQAKNWQPIGEFFPDPGTIEQKCHVFLATDLTSIQNTAVVQADNEVEDLEAGLFHREEIDTKIKSGEICDSWTISALYLYDQFTQQ